MRNNARLRFLLVLLVALHVLPRLPALSRPTERKNKTASQPTRLLRNYTL